jgi:hypothetical protein
VLPEESAADPSADSEPPTARNVESKKCLRAPDM